MPLRVLLGLLAAAAPQVSSLPPLSPQQQQQQQQQPPPKANAAIRGRATAADTSQPARRTQIRLNRIDGGRNGGPAFNLVVSTDSDGNYEFTGLVPGRYMLTASKNGYIPEPWGATEANAPPKPIEVQEGQTIEHVDFTLIRGSVITGRIFDETGEPISNVQVTVLRAMPAGGDQRRLVPGGRMSSTDDLGSFRIYGLPPGEYAVQATWRSNAPSSAESLGRTGYAPTFFPGTTDALSAQRFTLRAGQSVADVVMSLIPVATVRISGSVVDSHGAAVLNGSVLLTQQRAEGPVMGMIMNTPAPIRDGKFVFPGVAPGQYILRKMPNGSADAGESASIDLSVGNDDIADLRVITSPPLRVSGRIVFESGAALPPAPPRLILMPATPGIGVGPQQNATAKDDLTFELKAPPGIYRLQAQTMPPWNVRAVRIGGVDVMDDGIEVKPGRDVTGVEVDVTSRTQTITGTVSGSAEQVKDSGVIVFPADAKRSKNPQRYVRQARPGPDGKFTITGLPPGEYYAVGLEHYSLGPLPDADFLERQRPRATSFTLLEGDTRAIDLRLNEVP
ncbi:MAG TPA: carboxypeptidase regulatory-like domain-containing protein [Vicinamibacterales bacterium]|nr:carboxypeptidase regulatory-like domain-containing protein [Vicinamibacterales bacterium]